MRTATLRELEKEEAMSVLRLSVLFALTLALAVPGIAAREKPPPPPPPPPDSAADCPFVVKPSIDDYIVSRRCSSASAATRRSSGTTRLRPGSRGWRQPAPASGQRGAPLLPRTRMRASSASTCSPTTTIRSPSRAISYTAPPVSALSANGRSGPVRAASTTRGSDRSRSSQSRPPNRQRWISTCS